MKKIILGVEGMKCGMCESHVNDAIRKSFNVKSVESSHSSGQTVVIADDGVDVEELKKTVSEQGYTVTSEIVEPYEKKSFFARFKKN